MSVAIILMIVVFIILLIIGTPIAFNIIISSFIYFISSGNQLILIIQRMYEGISSFALLAIPFFVLTGQLMLKGKLLLSLVDVTNAFFGRIKGAIAIVTVITCLLMGAIVGLAVATAASLGSFLIPMMKDEGYDPGFSASVMSCGALLGPIMPPSVLMIVYTLAVGKTSVAGLFLSAVFPAVLITVSQCIIIAIIAKKRNYPSHPKTSNKEKFSALKSAFPALMLPVIILGGIFGKVFTVTEASAVAAFYSVILTVFINKTIKLKDLPNIILETALASGLVVILTAAAMVMSWAIANERIVHVLVEPLSGLNPYVFLFIVNIILLFAGMFMDDYATVLIICPIIAPIAWSLGIAPLHIAIVMCVNIVIGLATPPFGVALFVTSPIAGVPIERTVKEAAPLILVSILVLFVITYIPELVLFLPRLFGYI